MIVYRACIKIFRKNALLLIIYFGIFSLMAVSLAKQSKENAQKLYETAGVRVSVINEDDSEYADSLIKYLDNNTMMMDIVETDEGISDALFYRYTEYVIRIPQGFGRSISEGETVNLPKYEVAGSYSGVFMDNMINEYIAKMKIYGPEVPEHKAAEVELLGDDSEESMSIYISNFSAYSFMAIIILGVGTVLARFGEDDIRKRNNVSPVSAVRMSAAQVVSIISFTILVWLLTIAISAAAIGIENIGAAELYMALSMLVFAMVCMAMGFCLSTLIKSVNGRNVAANVISLGFSFIGGVMVPQEMLGNNVKLIGSFTPAYWFVRTNETLADMTSFDLSGMGEIWTFMGIEALFCIAFLTVGLAAVKKRSS